MEKLSYDEKYGKRRQITFRIGPIVQERLNQAATLFNMKPSEYAKAVLYKDLGVFNEPLDQRRRTWRQQKKKLEELDEEEPQEVDEESEEF
jgi:hypothetical protein